MLTERGPVGQVPCHFIFTQEKINPYTAEMKFLGEEILKAFVHSTLLKVTPKIFPPNTLIYTKVYKTSVFRQFFLIPEITLVI